MRIIKTIPQDREFFNEHGASLSKYGIIGLIGQLLSGLSLAYAVYSLLVLQTVGDVPPWATVSLAMVVGVFIELANRVLARPAIKPYVVKDQFTDDAEKQDRHRILNRSYLVGLIGVAMLSYLLSGVGSTYYAKDTTPPPTLSNTDSIFNAHQLRSGNVNATYKQDSALMVEPFNMRHSAAVQRFASDSLALMKERRKYRACANKGNKWCKGKLNEYGAKVDRSRLELSDTLAAIARERGAAMSRLVQARQRNIQSIEDERRAQLTKAESKDKKLIAEQEGETSFMGIIFIILTVAGQTVFYYMVYLTLQVEAGSGITYEVKPNEFWNLPTVMADARTGLEWRAERRARAFMQTLYAPSNNLNTKLAYRDIYTQATQQGGAQGNSNASSSHARANASRNGDVNVTQRQRNKGEVGSIEQCDNCGSDYVRKTTRQRFCSTDCRLEHHAKKHGGKRFDEHILNGKK